MDERARDSIPFDRKWWAFALPGFRDCKKATYCCYDYSALPPLPQLLIGKGDSFDWPPKLDAQVAQRMKPYREARLAAFQRTLKQTAQTPPETKEEVQKALQKNTEASLQEIKKAKPELQLPALFERVMGNLDVQDRIPSCTACAFELSDDVREYPGEQGSHIVRFLSDQQALLRWYLYFPAEGGSRVLVTTNDLDTIARQHAQAQKQKQKQKQQQGTNPTKIALEETLGMEVKQRFRRETWVCAESFVEFIARWWYENMLWFKLSEPNLVMSDEDRAYLKHFMPGKA